MSHYWNNVEILDSDISGASAKLDSSNRDNLVNSNQKAWGDDEATVKIGNESDESGEQFKARAKTLMPPFYKTQDEEADEATLKWEVEHRKRKTLIRSSNEFKFAMLIAGAANLKIDRIWTSSDDPKAMMKGGMASTNESADSFLTPAPKMDDLARAQQFQHVWSQTPEVSMELHLSPAIYYNVQSSLDMVKKHPRARNITVSKLISNATLRALFAGLVALNYKFSSFLSGLNYQLNENYARLKRERSMQLMRIVAAIKRNPSSSLD